MELVLVQACFWSEHRVTLRCEHKKYVCNNSAEPKQVIYLKLDIFLKLYYNISSPSPPPLLYTRSLPRKWYRRSIRS